MPEAPPTPPPDGPPPGGPPPDGSPPDGPPPGGQPTGRPVNAGAVAGGVVVGILGTWAIVTVAAVALLPTAYVDSTSTGPTVVMLAGLLALPVTALAFMISPRTRHAGAGLLMGVAIGSVVGAGLCGSILGL